MKMINEELAFTTLSSVNKLCFSGLRYDKNEELWTMRHVGKTSFLATSRALESSLLLGSHFWEVHNDSAKCAAEGKRSYTTRLTLHACGLQQFACDNAGCIQMEKRCDGKVHCNDGSDEKDCRKLIQRQGYKGTCQKRFSGFCPFRGGGTPQFR